jgi:hypothetical protein
MNRNEVDRSIGDGPVGIARAIWRGAMAAAIGSGALFIALNGVQNANAPARPSTHMTGTGANSLALSTGPSGVNSPALSTGPSGAVL